MISSHPGILVGFGVSAFLMRRSRFVVLCAFSSILLSAEAERPAFAQSTRESATLELDQVLTIAAANYPSIKTAQLRQKAANNEIGLAKTAYLPRTDILWQTDRATANNVFGLVLPQTVVPSVTGPVLDADVTRSAWNSTGGALLSWQPFDFGARGAKVDVARHGSEAAKYASDSTQLQVSAAAGSAFFDLAAAQELMKAARANVQRYEEFAKAVHVLVDNTLRPGADASQADAQLALARNQLIHAETQAAIKSTVLAELIQVQNSHPEIDVSALLSSMPTIDPAIASGTNHPAILEEHALTLQQEAQERFLNRSYVPIFTTSGAIFGRGAGTSVTGPFPGGTAGLAPNIFNWAAGIQVSFSAFDFFNLREQRRVQQANVQAEHARLDQAVSNVTAAVQQAEATLAGARRLVQNTPAELAAARMSEQQQQARYRSGLATVVDVSAAEGVLAQAEGDDAIARLGVWRAELGIAVAQGNLQPFLQLLQSQTKGK